MPLDVLVAAAVINRWIAVPLLACVWAFGHASSVVNQEFAQGFVVAALYGMMGFGPRRVLENEIRDYLVDWRAKHPRKQTQ